MFSVITFNNIFEKYGLVLTGKETEKQLQELKLALESINDMEEFLEEVKSILNA